MKHPIILLSLFILIAGFRDGDKKKPRNPADIKSIVIFPAIAEITQIESSDSIRSMPVIDSVQSKRSALEITRLTKLLLPDSIQSGILHTDSSTLSKMKTAIYDMAVDVNKSKRNSNIPAPAILLNLLDTLHQDFGIVITQIGFKRSPENIAKLQFNYNLLSIGTLASLGVPGMVSIKVNPCSSTMNMYIIDRQNKNVAFFALYELKNTDPTDNFMVKIQLRRLINDYFINGP